MKKKYLFLFYVFLININSQLLASTNDYKNVISNLKKKIFGTTQNNEMQNVSMSNEGYNYKINSSNAEIYAIYNIKEFNEDDNIIYKGIQGFTTDGEYFYVALLNSNDKDYIKQETKILKIDIKTKKVVQQKHIGRIGHSGSLTYNPLTKMIYCSPSSYSKPYVYSFDTDLNLKNTYYLKNENNEVIKSIKRINTLAYDKTSNLYFTKVDKSNRDLFFFDSDFKFKQKINCSDEVLKANTLLQTINCDDKNAYVVSFVKGSVPLINYIRVFDLKTGKLINEKILSDELAPNNEIIEMEQLTFLNGECYGLANIIRKNQFCIFKLTYINNLKKEE